VTRNYDYLSDNADALRTEIEALDRRVAELEAERDAAVLAEREACVKVAAGLLGCDADELFRDVDAIRSRP
jgi:phage shock protein A